MSAISPIDFMKFCISQGFEFVLVDDDNKIINLDNVEEIESILDRSNRIPMNMRKTNAE